MRLLTIHNLAYLQRLMAELRDAIDAGRLAEARRGGGPAPGRRAARGAVSDAEASRRSRPPAGATARRPTTR